MLIFCHVDKNIDDELLDAAYKLSLDERRSKADKLINPQKKEISLAAGMLERLMQEKYKYKFQNLSHSDEYAVCIGEDRLCGVDIQKICNVSENLKKRVCTPKELEAIENAPNPDLRFIQYWALKEACFKARGSQNFFDFFKKICMIERPPSDFELETFVFRKDYVVATCVKKPDKFF